MSFQTSEVDPGLWIVFNGAIYNHSLLRDELLSKGHVFHTRTDTEVLLAACSVWGSQALKRLDGMFAFALFDARNRKLVVARDRFGEKPLHWAIVTHAGQTGLAFASDIRQLLPFLPGGARIERTALADFLNDGVVDRRSTTFFDGVHRVPPGSFATIDLSPGVVAPKFERYTTSSFRQGGDLRGDLEDAVGIRLKADVPVGACLSGGLDSSLIVSLSRVANVRLQTVTALYDEPALSEREFLALAEAHLNPQATHVKPTAISAFEAYPRVLFAQGEPFANTSVISQWLVFAAAHEIGLKVMLDGQGADELFAGYVGMAPYHLADLARSGRAFQWALTLARLARNNGDMDAVEFARMSLGILRSWRRPRPSQTKGAIVPNIMTASSLPPLVGASGFEELTSRLVFRDSLPGLLRYEDRNSMDHGIEARLPYLAPAIADIALQMDGATKLAGGWTKAPLRAVARTLLPDAIVWRRRKLGFATPLESWLKEQPWREWSRSGLADAAERFSGLLDLAELARLRRGVEMNEPNAALVFRIAHAADWSRAFGASL